MPAALRTIALVAAAALAVASTPGGPLEEPEVDSCANATDTDATAVDIGRDGIGPFSALSDGETVRLIQGFQGTDMLPVRFLVDGISADCVAQLTEVRYCPPDTTCPDGGELITTSNVGLQTYEHDASRITADHFLIMGALINVGGTLVVETTVAGATDSVSLVIGEFR